MVHYRFQMSKDYSRQALRIDKQCRYGFPLTFLAWNLWYWWYYLVFQKVDYFHLTGVWRLLSATSMRTTTPRTGGQRPHIYRSHVHRLIRRWNSQFILNCCRPSTRFEFYDDCSHFAPSMACSPRPLWYRTQDLTTTRWMLLHWLILSLVKWIFFP